MVQHRTLAGAAFAGLMVVTVPAACSAPAVCGTGATSAEGAVETLLRAVAADDVAQACTVTTAADVDDTVLVAYVDQLTGFLDDAGGPDAVTVRELPERQMGSGIVVEVVARDQRLEVDVVQSGGRYRVAASEPLPADGEPTTGPERPGRDR